MAENDSTPKGILEFQIERKMVNLGKNFLTIIEDLIDEGWLIPNDKYNRIRKRIWDGTGDSFREIKSNLDKFDIKLKNQ